MVKVGNGRAADIIACDIRRDYGESLFISWSAAVVTTHTCPTTWPLKLVIRRLQADTYNETLFTRPHLRLIKATLIKNR